MAAETPAQSESEAWLRGVLRGTSASIFAITVVELFLQEHTGGGVQNLPFIACGLGLLATGILSFGPQTDAARRSAWTLLGLVVAASSFGVWEHVEHNYAFTREIKPTLTVGQAFLDSLFGASPLLAPGILALAAFLAWASSVRRRSPT